MICTSCSFENEAGNKFCGGCGKPLARQCRNCSAELAPAAKFCGQCGTPVAEFATRSPEFDTERRFVTVMFCDLEGSTELSSMLDPEELLAVIRKYQTEVAKVVERFSGHIAQYLGDGILVYFGYPSAHEDDVQRAVTAAVDILEKIAELNESELQNDHALSLTARIGIHSGPVVAGEIGAGESRERLALGQTPNIAARLESIAASGTVAVSKATRDLVVSGFYFESLGLKQLKGVPDDVEVFRVYSKNDEEQRLELPAGPARTPLVGRMDELRRLKETFEAACTGHGAMVEIRADAGFGKSRLVQAFLDSCRDIRHTAVYGRSTALESATSFSGVANLLKRRFQVTDRDSDAAKLAMLESQLRRHAIEPGDFVPVLADLLSINTAGAYEVPELVGAELRAETVEVVARFLGTLADEQPLLVVFEDLHWADSATLAVLDGLGQMAMSQPVFCLMTTRPTFDHAWSRDVHRVELQPLQRPEVETIATTICGGKSLPGAVMDQIVEKSDGIPLYVEEVTKVVLESAGLVERASDYEFSGSAEAIDVPRTLQGWLTARLDRLGAVRELAQVASVLGREFTVEMLAAIAQQDVEKVREGLSQLEEAEMVYATKDSNTYLFKHALICDAAYNLLLKKTRRQLHGTTARMLLERFPSRAESQPELIARHFEAAAEWREAVTYWSLAARHAMRQGATVEAVSDARAGLALVQNLNEEGQGAGLEMVLQTSLAESLAATQGYVAPEVEAAYARAQELGEGVTNSEDQFWILMGISFFHIVRGDLDAADHVGRQLVNIAQNLGRADLEAYANNSLTCAQYFEGNFAPAMTFLEKSMDLATPDDQLFRERTGTDIGVNHLYYKALLLWHQGLYDESREASQEAVRIARLHENDYSLVLALVFASVDAGFARRDFDEVLRASQEVIELASGRPFGVWGVQGEVFNAWARLANPESREAMTRQEQASLCQQCEAALAMYRGSGAGLKVPFMQAALAESQLNAGLPDRAWKVINEGIFLAESGTDKMWLAELHRLKGRCLQARGAPAKEQIEAFSRAASIARSQGTIALEHRAAAELAESGSS